MAFQKGDRRIQKIDSGPPFFLDLYSIQNSYDPGLTRFENGTKLAQKRVSACDQATCKAARPRKERVMPVYEFQCKCGHITEERWCGWIPKRLSAPNATARPRKYFPHVASN
jgi:hypothetical protein